MPCRPRKARILLQSGKAKVIRRTPFTIQLIYGSSGYVQPISLGVDAGSKVLGLSATTEQKVLFEAEVQLRADVVDLLSTRREFRRARRNRKTRYRQPRFLNRRRPDGWLAPSVENKIVTQRQENKAAKYVHNFKLFDKVMYDNQECFVFGRLSSGYFDLRLLDGTKVHALANVKRLRLLERAKSLLIERRMGDGYPSLKRKVSIA